MSKKPTWAVKRGRTFTTFVTLQEAYRFWQSCIGSAIKMRNDKGKWVNPF